MSRAESPMDMEAVRLLANERPDFTALPDALAYGAKLHDQVQALLAEGGRIASELAVDSGQRIAALRIVEWSQDIVSRDLGETLHAAFWQLENLSAACRLLLNLVMSAQRTAFCNCCLTYTEDTLIVGMAEAGTGPGGALRACSVCRTRFGLSPSSDEPATQTRFETPPYGAALVPVT